MECPIKENKVKVSSDVWHCVIEVITEANKKLNSDG